MWRYESNIIQSGAPPKGEAKFFGAGPSGFTGLQGDALLSIRPNLTRNMQGLVED